jgi:hypothetical protein
MTRNRQLQQLDQTGPISGSFEVVTVKASQHLVVPVSLQSWVTLGVLTPDINMQDRDVIVSMAAQMI